MAKYLLDGSLGGGISRMLKPMTLAAMLVAAPLATAQNSEDVDPLESVNRAVFSFNDFLDRCCFQPIARGYKAVTPQFLDDGISNVFINLGEPINALNDLLQWKPADAGKDVGRFAINSTIGLLGFFDVAGHWGMQRSEEDFGQTLAGWGLSSGPYLVLPFLGPSTVRDLGGQIVDYPLSYNAYINDDAVRLPLNVVNLVDTRADLLSAEGIISGDRYLFIRDAFLQRRDFLINDGEVEDTFGFEEDF